MITYSSCLQVVPFCSVLCSFWFYFLCLYYCFTLTCSKLTEIILSYHFISTWHQVHYAPPLVSQYIYLHFYGKVQKGTKKMYGKQAQWNKLKKEIDSLHIMEKGNEKRNIYYRGDRNDEHHYVCHFHTFQIYLITVLIYLITVLTCEWLCLNCRKNGPPDSEVFHL